MSTKNLARTAIEPGRTNSYKLEVRDAKRQERTALRTALRRCQLNPEHFDEVAMPLRRPVYVEQKDHLAPAERWVAKNALNLHRTEIEGLILTHFETRTLAGRHIVFDHLLGGRPRKMYPPAGTYFDEEDILRRVEPRPPTEDESRFPHWKDVRRWAKDRRVTVMDGALHWTKRVTYTEDAGIYFKSKFFLTRETFEPAERLNQDELSFWNRLSRRQQGRLH